jgi:hypothetical protein
MNFFITRILLVLSVSEFKAKNSQQFFCPHSGGKT